MADDALINGFTRDELRRFALENQISHTPGNQEGNGYQRCALCHYTRHPCDVYDLATAVLWLLDEGRTGQEESDAD